MNKVKVAKELVKLAKELTATAVNVTLQTSNDGKTQKAYTDGIAIGQYGESGIDKLQKQLKDMENNQKDMEKDGYKELDNIHFQINGKRICLVQNFAQQ